MGKVATIQPITNSEVGGLITIRCRVNEVDLGGRCHHNFEKQTGRKPVKIPTKTHNW